jgi:hypothetical protein
MESMNENRTNNDKQATSAPTGQGGQGAQANAGSAAPSNGADDMLKLMGENQKTCALGQWMKCLRKPALSMQYTLEKRHIPDMDNDPTGQTAGKGSNSDTMSVTGGFTIRYFDLAAGAMTLLLAGCMIKALCCVKKMM